MAKQLRNKPGSERAPFRPDIIENYDVQEEGKLLEFMIAAMPQRKRTNIKELLKLTAKWCRQKNVAPTLDVFKTCAQFRGM